MVDCSLCIHVGHGGQLDIRLTSVVGQQSCFCKKIASRLDLNKHKFLSQGSYIAG